MSSKNYHKEAILALELGGYDSVKLMWWIAAHAPAVFCDAVNACSCTKHEGESEPMIKLVRILTFGKLEAIKALHNAVPGLGLREAKEACDLIETGTPYVLPKTFDRDAGLNGVFEIR